MVRMYSSGTSVRMWRKCLNQYLKNNRWNPKACINHNGPTSTPGRGGDPAVGRILIVPRGDINPSPSLCKLIVCGCMLGGVLAGACSNLLLPTNRIGGIWLGDSHSPPLSSSSSGSQPPDPRATTTRHQFCTRTGSYLHSRTYRQRGLPRLPFHGPRRGAPRWPARASAPSPEVGFRGVRSGGVFGHGRAEVEGRLEKIALSPSESTS